MLSQITLHRASNLSNLSTNKYAPNAGCVDLESNFRAIKMPDYTFDASKNPSVCVTMSRGGFVVAGEDITIKTREGYTEEGAFGASAGTYVISTTKTNQKVNVYYIDSEVESELILITKSNWKGAITLEVEKKGTSTAKFNNQYIAFFNVNKMTASVKPQKDSLVYHNKEAEDVYEVEYLSRQFVQIGIKSSVNITELAKKENFRVVGKLNVNVKGNKNSIPEKIIKIEPDMFFTPNSPEFEVVDYAGFVGLPTDEAIAVVVGAVLGLIIVGIIVFSIVYFVILKKPCCGCCRCCTCCPGNKETNHSDTAVALI